ncbi:uncharacterized protein LOC111052490 [Nilaparvata lugens]|uniref:uncharacterized protein LOC111052490 n=1 Tax=Nilaparvata lugens TaxID=108931 RepID=UPI00193D9AD3|nr:uncharacterized protein LOC111052490 [Nilaparvata lugens]
MLGKLGRVNYCCVFILASLVLQFGPALSQEEEEEAVDPPVVIVPAPTAEEIFRNLFTRTRPPLCDLWETIDLTMNDVDLSHPDNNITIITENTTLTGYEFSHEDVFGLDEATMTGRVCACHIAETPCIPLCCHPDRLGSMKDGKLTCGATNSHPKLDEKFSKYLKAQKNMERGKFVPVHHNGLATMSKCVNEATHSYRPGTLKYIDTKDGILSTKEDSAFKNDEYCFLAEKGRADITFVPVYCQKVQPKPPLSTPKPPSKPSSALQTIPSSKTAVFCSIASILIVYLVVQ